MAPRTKETIKPTPQPDWQSPRVAQPVSAIAPSKKLNVMEKAIAAVGLPREEISVQVLAAIIIAQAADRLGEKLVEAAAVGRYRGA